MITTINEFRQYLIQENDEILDTSFNEDTMEITNVNISNINPGDTIIHNGYLRTVTKKDIHYDSFMGVTIFGDSYKSGNKLVKKITFKTNV